MINTCSTCKWWNPPMMFRDGKMGTGNLWQYELGECLSGNLRLEYPTRRPDDPKQSQDSDACITPADHATLRCGPAFGCVHHRPKE